MTILVKRNVKLVYFVVFASFLATGTMRAANFLLNGSFETTGTLSNSCGTGCTYSVSSPGAGTDSTTIPDWTVNSFTTAGIVNLTSGTGNTESSYFPPPDGSAYAFINGGTIQQTVSETVVGGDTYNLTAWIANASQGYNQFVESVYVNGNSIALFGAGPNVLATEGGWSEVGGSFLAPTADAGETMTVVLFNQGGSGQSAFDDVCLTDTSCSLTSQTTATPEPSSLLLLGTGLVGMAGFARRRLRRA